MIHNYLETNLLYCIVALIVRAQDSHHLPRYDICVDSGMGIHAVAVGYRGRVSHGNIDRLIPIEAT